MSFNPFIFWFLVLLLDERRAQQLPAFVATPLNETEELCVPMPQRASAYSTYLVTYAKGRAFMESNTKMYSSARQAGFDYMMNWKEEEISVVSPDCHQMWRWVANVTRRVPPAPILQP